MVLITRAEIHCAGMSWHHKFLLLIIRLLPIGFYNRDSLQNDVLFAVLHQSARPQTMVGELFQNDYLYLDGLAPKDRLSELISLEAIDCTEAGQLLSNQGGDEGGQMNSMGNAFFEYCRCGPLIADMEGVHIADQGGKAAYNILGNQRSPPGPVIGNEKGLIHFSGPYLMAVDAQE